MDRLEDLEAFVAIVEHGSQTAAAKKLQRSLQAIGRSLGALEKSCGVELVRRSTRHSQVTETGRALYQRLAPALREIEDAEREAASRRGEPFGRLKVAAPIRFASTFVVPALCELTTRFPSLEVELHTSDRKVDLFAEQVDVAIRIRELPDSGLRMRKLAALRVVVFGAPSYFARHGRPRHPSELTRHACVLRNADPEPEKWPFRIRGKRELVSVRGPFRCDDASAQHEAVACGAGLGIAPAWQLRPLLERGAVEIVLAEFEADKLPICAVSASKVPPAKSKLFVDLLAQRLKRAEF